MARRPIPGSRVSHADIDDLEAAHGEEIPFRRSTPPPAAPAAGSKSIEQIADLAGADTKRGSSAHGEF